MTSRLQSQSCSRELQLAKGLLARSLMLAGLLVAAHLAGWRENTSVICGMYPITGPAAWIAGGTGIAYVLCYLLATLVAPILLLAGGMLWGWVKWRQRRETHLCPDTPTT